MYRVEKLEQTDHENINSRSVKDKSIWINDSISVKMKQKAESMNMYKV